MPTPTFPMTPVPAIIRPLPCYRWLRDLTYPRRHGGEPVTYLPVVMTCDCSCDTC